MDRRSTARLATALALASLAMPAFAAAAGERAAQGAAPGRERTAPDAGLDRPSVNGVYRVRVAPMEQPTPLHRLHDWRLVIEHDGKPVEGAVVQVGGGMPLHFHGYPKKPVVEPALAGGYLIRGVEFSMRGWWQLKLDIGSREGADRVTFNLRL